MRVDRHWAYLQDLTAKTILNWSSGSHLVTSEDCFASVVFRADWEEMARAVTDILE